MDTGARVLEFQTRDLDESLRFITDRFGPHSRVLKKPGRYAFHIRAAIGSKVLAGECTVGLPYVLHVATQTPTVHLPLAADLEYRIGRRSLRATPDTAVFLAPRHAYTLDSPGGTGLAVQVDPDMLEQAVDARLPRLRRPRSPRCVELPLTAASKARFLTLQRRFSSALSSDPSGQASGRALRTMELDLVDWLADRLLEQSGLEMSSRPSLRHVRHLPDWIDGHLGEKLELDDLCAATGIRHRFLQKLCLAAYGVTPLELVQLRRLAAVRRGLEAAGTDTTVSRCALDCGFSHLGRFATLYRETFGESPSETLGRARDRRRPVRVASADPA